MGRDLDWLEKQGHISVKAPNLPLREIPLQLLIFGLVCAACSLGFVPDVSASPARPAEAASWRGLLHDAAGHALAGATVELGDVSTGRTFASRADARGGFSFADLPAGSYAVSVRWSGGRARLMAPLAIGEGQRQEAWLELSADQKQVVLHRTPGEVGARASGEERLSSKEVSSLPLNKRDFSQLLLLAAGTMTDTNGAANFTQQFAVNGQRGMNAVFAMDGIYTTDPELGGATFTNFNVDAIQEIRSDSGVMPAEVGEGAAGFTNVVTKSGAADVHGTVFEFARNAAFDARNFFDRRTIANPGRIPPFVRNEFGFTNGGPVVLPGLYNGRDRTFYFGEYQGFRQVLGTTQVFPVPSVAERQGIDTTTFAGDTLFVPVNPQIASVVARYPVPNDLQGAFGPRTFATSSKVSTISNQFSLRLDHRISDKAQLFARFTFDNMTGPTTNPSQIAIDPLFAIRFFDHQRNFGLTYTRAVSPNFTWESSLGALRTTPSFPSLDHVEPGMVFGDGLYEPFNSAAGQFLGTFGNLFQARQNFTYLRGTHTFKWGFEARFNRDTAIFGFFPNGLYTFGGGTAYSPVEIPSGSGLHDIHVGDPLPDSLTGFLTGTPFEYMAAVAAPPFPGGDHIGESAIRREAYNAYFQDAWKITPRFVLSYGLRYEENTRMGEADHRSSNTVILGPSGKPVPYWAPGAHEEILFNPQPPYQGDLGDWGPRVSVQWRPTDSTTLRAGGAITTILPGLFQEDMLTGGVPFVINPQFIASPGQPVPFQATILHFTFPPMLTPSGQPVVATGNTRDVPPNTVMDLLRFEEDLAAITPGHQVQALSVFATSLDFQNGYIESFTAGIDHSFGDIQVSASYVGTTGVKLPSLAYPNAYAGADPAYARFTRFDAVGNVDGGFGLEFFISNRSHSTFHSFQTSVQKVSPRAGLGFQASYTLSKSLDDSSSVFSSLGTNAGAVLQPPPADPRHTGLEKGPSTFDLRHVVVFNVIQALPFERLGFRGPLGRKLTSGWQFLNISTLTSRPPFSVISGIQQTGLGSNGGDRPDQIGEPVFSTRRKIREDYFGQGADNANFFFIPINTPGGTGPNHGRLGTLGRNTFRGPAFHNLDAALIKDTAFGHRGNGEMLTLQFRAEVFNIFNLVNFGLPDNIVRGSGFGFINRTAGPSRQIQFSLKLFY